MFRPVIFVAASLIVLTACSTASEAPVDGPSAAAEAGGQVSAFDLALKTSDELQRAGNTPAAIQRLMQLVGDTSLSGGQKADTLVKLGNLSLSASGYNAEGGVGYYKEAISDHPGTAGAAEAARRLPAAEAKVAVLVATLGSVDASQSEQFLALMNLGRHQEAIDLMLAHDLSPQNEELLAMYQIGYLCDEPGLTGRVYSVNDRDGTVRKLRFCDFGK